MAKPKLIFFLLIICGNSLPFLWHKSFWKSVKDVCIAYCAISIGTEKCIWGECVDALTKKCTPFFQRIQSQPLKYLAEGNSHKIHAIGNTDLVSKSLDGNSAEDKKFVTEIVHRLPTIYGINRPLCVTEGEKNQYKVISERIFALESYRTLTKGKFEPNTLYPIIHKYEDIINHVFTVLAEWIRKSSGLAVNDWDVGYYMGYTLTHNIALTLTGEPTFFDFDVAPRVRGLLQFDRRGTSLPKLTEEIIKNAREELETAMGNPEWKEFTKVFQIFHIRLAEAMKEIEDNDRKADLLRTPVAKCPYSFC